MSSLTFKALIDAIHYDSKKGSVKIVLIGASHVSLDELTTLSPKDETIQVTFESEQTKLKAYSLVPGDPIMLDEEAAAKLKEDTERSKEEYAGDDK